jgi:hypothetical protein
MVFVIGGMGGVTTGAPSFGHGFMHYPGAFNLFHNFLGLRLVAVDTEAKFVLSEKKLGCVGAVRVMTTNASFIFYYFMQILGLAHQKLLVFVASPA